MPRTQAPPSEVALTYINGKYRGAVETIDQFDTHRDARSMIREYRLAFGSEWTLWLSSRSTKEWREGN